LGGLSIHTHDLLALPVRKPAQDARFRRRGATRQAEDVTGGNILPSEILDQIVPGGVVAYRPHRHNPSPQIRKVVRSVGSASGDNLLFALLEDQYGRLPGDPGDFAVNELVSDKVAEQHNPLAGKPVQDCEQGGAI
jgi:hypothetical protein